MASITVKPGRLFYRLDEFSRGTILSLHIIHLLANLQISLSKKHRRDKLYSNLQTEHVCRSAAKDSVADSPRQQVGYASNSDSDADRHTEIDPADLPDLPGLPDLLALPDSLAPAN